MLVSIVGLNGMGVFTFAITFLELEPVYKCTYVDTETGAKRVEICDAETVCLS